MANQEADGELTSPTASNRSQESDQATPLSLLERARRTTQRPGSG